MTCITQQFGEDVIAVVWGDSDEETEATANLIKAAPLLFKACQAQLAFTQKRYDDNSVDEARQDYERVKAMMLEAMAVACRKGEKP